MRIRKSLLAASLVALGAAGAFAQDFAEKQVTCALDRNHFNPQWSIDRPPRCDIRGDRLVFEVRETNGEGKRILRLYLTTKVGKDSPDCPSGFSESAPISDDRTITSRVQWNPVSGDVLVAQKKIGSFWQLVKIVVGGGEQILTNENYHHVNPQWSQDGKFIVFEKRQRTSPGVIAVLCANGCNEIVAETPADGSNRRFPSFHLSTSGHLPGSPYSVVYEVETGGAVTDIASFRFDDLASGVATGSETRVTHDGEADRFPQFVDDFYVWQRFDFAVARWQVADRPASLATPVRLLTEDLESGDAEADHLVPRVALNNQQKIIYVKDEPPSESGGEGGTTLFRLIRPIAEDDRPIERRVIGPGCSAPQWSPNGDNIVFEKRVDGRWQVFILDSVR